MKKKYQKPSWILRCSSCGTLHGNTTNTCQSCGLKALYPVSDKMPFTNSFLDTISEIQSKFTPGRQQWNKLEQIKEAVSLSDSLVLAIKQGGVKGLVQKLEELTTQKDN